MTGRSAGGKQRESKRRRKASADRDGEEQDFPDDEREEGGEDEEPVRDGKAYRKRKQPASGAKSEEGDEDAEQTENVGDAREDEEDAEESEEDKGRGGKAPFDQGEKVLAYHGDLLYYAKILEVERDASGRCSFFIHYMGWKKSWDEWVGTERLLKDTPGNQRRKTELEKGHHNNTHTSPQHHSRDKKGTPKAKASPKETPKSPASRGVGKAKGSVTSPLAPTSASNGTPQSAGGASKGRKSREASESREEAQEGRHGGAAPGSAQETSVSGERSSQRNGTTATATDSKVQQGHEQAAMVSPGPDVKQEEHGQEIEQGQGQASGQGQGQGQEQAQVRVAPKEVMAPELCISIPLPLKKQLVSDEDYIVHKGELLRLPARPTVKEILEQFVEHRRRELSSSTSGEALEELMKVIEDIMKALRDYFDRTLPLMLLYRQERQQYVDHFPPSTAVTVAPSPSDGEETAAKEPPTTSQTANQQPSDVYGGEHLLRLFTKLPSMMSYMAMEDETKFELQAHLSTFLKFMVKNQSSLFSSASRYSKSEGESNGIVRAEIQPSVQSDKET